MPNFNKPIRYWTLQLVLVLHVAIILNLPNKRASFVSEENFLLQQNIVDARNSLPNTVFSATSTNNFKTKLCEVNVYRFLTIVECFCSYVCVYFLYCIVFYMCFNSISVAVWPFLLIWNEMKWKIWCVCVPLLYAFMQFVELILPSESWSAANLNHTDSTATCCLVVSSLGFVLLHFAWVVDDAKYILVTRVCVCVCLSVCLSAAACPHYCTDPDVTLGVVGMPPPIVHYCADLQPVHGFRRYGNITRTRNVSEYTLVLALWCIVSVVELLSKFYISIFSLCDFSFRSSSACMCLPCAAKFNAIKLVSIPVLPNNIVVSFTPLYRYKPITCTWCRLYLTAYVAAVDFIFFKMADAAILHIYNF